MYLDHAATTPLDERVLERMLPWFTEFSGNPSSLHSGGRKVRAAIDLAREQLADAFGASFSEVLFTSSGTESIATAILGTALSYRSGQWRAGPEMHGESTTIRPRILIGAADHHASTAQANGLQALGFEVEMVPVNEQGQVEPEQIEALIGDDVLLVSVLHANNEVGSITNVSAIGDHCAACGAWFHVDAVQSFGTHRNLVDTGATLITVSSHKIYGPVGAAALYIKAGAILEPLLRGGGQERDLRGGTENAPAIIGFGAATQLQLYADRSAKDAYFEALGQSLPAESWVRTVRAETPQLAGHAHAIFPGVDAQTLLIRLDREGIFASAGAACSSGSVEPSHVLKAMGYSDAYAESGLRVTFGAGQGRPEGAEAARRIAKAVLEIRALRGT